MAFLHDHRLWHLPCTLLCVCPGSPRQPCSALCGQTSGRLQPSQCPLPPWLFCSSSGDTAHLPFPSMPPGTPHRPAGAPRPCRETFRLCVSPRIPGKCQSGVCWKAGEQGERRWRRERGMMMLRCTLQHLAWQPPAQGDSPSKTCLSKRCNKAKTGDGSVGFLAFVQWLQHIFHPWFGRGVSLLSLLGTAYCIFPSLSLNHSLSILRL